MQRSIHSLIIECACWSVGIFLVGGHLYGRLPDLPRETEDIQPPVAAIEVDELLAELHSQFPIR